MGFLSTLFYKHTNMICSILLKIPGLSNGANDPQQKKPLPHDQSIASIS